MENAFGILVSRFRVLLDTMKQRLDRADSAAFQAYYIAVLQNEQVVYVPDDNYRNPSRETKYQRDLLKDNFNHLSALAGQKVRVLDGSYPGDRRS